MKKTSASASASKKNASAMAEPVLIADDRRAPDADAFAGSLANHPDDLLDDVAPAEYLIDLNADIGEGMEEQDNALMKLVSSVNIACGMHAGSPEIMLDSVEKAIEHGLSVGAHPSYPDREHFGRKDVEMAPRALYAAIQYQVGALQAMVAAHGHTLRHVKPHGALYNRSAKDAAVAEVIAAAIQDMDLGLTLFALAGSESVKAARRLGLAVLQEAFADRRYLADGSLVPRSQDDAVISDPKTAFEQTLFLIRDGKIRTTGRKTLSVSADTICLHGDNPDSVTIAQAIRDGLVAHGVQIGLPVWHHSSAPGESLFPLL